MAAYGRPSLRDLFDESPTPHIAHPPRTHHRDFYVATDGSFSDGHGGLGVVIETRDGERVGRFSLSDRSPDNNVAEYRALHLGLDVLAARAPASARVGVLVDHDDLAANVNAAVLRSRDPTHESTHHLSVPAATGHHWRGIRARLNGFGAVRAARISSDRNPAHPLANAPDQYAHVNAERERCVLPEPIRQDDDRYPPPSRVNSD
ncbi:reverse transcriptase-like protein [Halapricum sp. CBA1109]|uniref:ribonuclease HI n=1 Tax=Halapricum sp. CBA1109 TaxID=2668068 RepID=UPI0012F7F141|nr:reverse transcriptase-like protein [Halapricum sp. CBA1109]MUV90710.1 reverse transcriptase-like protein [Halapricum sp. CBA1109]